MKTYNLPPRLSGTTFKPLQITLRYQDTTPISLVGAAVKLQFRSGSKTGPLKKEITNGNGITIANAAGGVMQIDEFILTGWAAGKYYYDVLIIFASEVREIYFGGTQEIIQNVTQE